MHLSRRTLKQRLGKHTAFGRATRRIHLSGSKNAAVIGGFVSARDIALWLRAFPEVTCGFGSEVTTNTNGC
jgi:hypothetical protein